MRVVVLVLCALSLTACGWLWPSRSEFSALEQDEAFTAQAADSVLVFGLTVRGPAAGELEGEVTWLVEKPDQSFPTLVAMSFPEGIMPGQRSLIAWRVPAGTWSLRQVTWRTDGQGGETLPAAGRQLATITEPGKVTYAGDIVVDGGEQPARLSVSDAAGFGGNLPGFPGVQAPTEDRPLRDLRAAEHRHSAPGR